MMFTYLVNGEYEFQAPNLETCYEMVNSLGIVIEEVEDITEFYESMHRDLDVDFDDDFQPTEHDEWMSFDADC
jgi:hypothetical protein